MPTPSTFPEPGIYLHMEEAAYHAIPAFSKSLVKKFLISDIDAWEMLHGENRETTDDLDYGSAFHCLILEGREAFDARYCKAFDRASHPTALDTADELKKFLKSQGQEFKASDAKPALIERVQAFAPDRGIIDILKAEHAEQSAGKTLINKSMYDEIVSREWVRNVSFLQDSQATEISLFWHDEHFGFPCKARLDSIGFRKTMAGMTALIGDAKTFTNTRQKPILECVNYETGAKRYHIDGYFYTRALKSTPRIIHDDSKAKWPDFKDIAFELLYIEKGRRFPNVVPRELAIYQLGELTELGMSAAATVQDAANRFAALQKERGAKPWNTVHAHDVITEAQIPIYLL